ncbi:MAG: helix-turn-helix domain-containing protein [Lachnospiraceae bacterium]|nr:helix-turn-helix domain-containing protein [Lachnospiraceae bacterium]
MISYNGLFEILERRNMKKTDLLKIISSGTLAKLNKGQNLQTEVIDKICFHLNVQPGEIMQYYKINNISLITQETDPALYLAGYRQKISMAYPSVLDDVIQPPSVIKVSKYIYNNTEDIINGKMDIPKTFLDESTLQIFDATYRNAISNINKNNE